MGYYNSCKGSGVDYKPCGLNLDFLDDGSMSMYEKQCYMIKIFQDALNGLDGLDEALALKEDVAFLTTNRKLSLTGDFTGTWNGETLAEVKQEFQLLIDALQLEIDALELEDDRIELKFDNEVIRLDEKIDDEVATLEASLSTKEESLNITNNRLLSPTGNFTGTWNGETYNDFKDHITNGETLYADVIALIQANPNIGITVRDGGFLASLEVPTVEDFGLVTDLPTLELDYGLVIYPCSCTI